jgi:hypothetical protein
MGVSACSESLHMQLFGVATRGINLDEYKELENARRSGLGFHDGYIRPSPENRKFPENPLLVWLSATCFVME